MMKFSTVLNQLLQFLPQHEFEKAITTFKSDRYVKYFKTKALFVVHLYAQVRKKDSLRDIVCGLEQHQSKWYHIGIEKIKRSTISDANNRLPYQVYERGTVAKYPSSKNEKIESEKQGLKMPDNIKLGTDESSEDHSRNGVFQNQPILRQSHFLRVFEKFVF